MAKILIVDDDANFREMVQAVLGEEGYETSIAENGAVAVQTFNNVQPDLVIIDMLMPKMGGFDCAEALRGTPAGESTPLIFVSGVFKGAKTANEATDKYNSAAFLVKPFEAEVLIGAVADALGASGAAVEEPEAAEPMLEAGTLVEYPVPGLLLRISDEKHTGILEIYGETQRARLFFRRGNAVMGSVADPQINVAMTLVRMGQMSPFDYKALLEHMDDAGVDMYSAIKEFKSVKDKAIKEAYRQTVPLVIAAAVPLTGNFRWVATNGFMRLIPTTSVPIKQALYLGLDRAPHELIEKHLAPRVRMRLNKGPNWQFGKEVLTEGLKSDDVLKSVNGRARVAQIFGSAPNEDRKRSRMVQLFALISTNAVVLSEEIMEVEPSLVQPAPVQMGAEPEIEIEEARVAPPQAQPAPESATPSQAFVEDASKDTEIDAGLEFSDDETAARERIVNKFREIKDQDHYAVLGMSRDEFGADAAKKNYFALARNFHSDAHSGMRLGSAADKLEAVFAKISEAYEVLSDDAKRDEFNAHLDLSAEGGSMDVAAIMEAESLLDKAIIVADRGDFTGASRYLDEAMSMHQGEAIQVWHAYCGFRARGNQPEEAPKMIQGILTILKTAKVERAYEFCGIISRFAGDLKKARKYLNKAKEEDGSSPGVERELRLIAKKQEEGEKKGGIAGKLFGK